VVVGTAGTGAAVGAVVINRKLTFAF